jgi:ubiquitin conjugation factor E4 B
MFNFLVVLSKDSQDILLSNELGEKYCSQINYYLNEITEKSKRKQYNIKNKYDVGFQPLNLLDFLTKILLSCINHPMFIDFMAKDTRSYKTSNIKFAIDKLWSNHLLTQNEYDKLCIVSRNIDDKIKEEEEIEFPDEFCDPLMACEIKVPVMLPDTDIITEKSVISRHLLTDLNNPFNREPLTMEQLDKFNKKSKVKDLLKTFMKKKESWKKEFS